MDEHQTTPTKLELLALTADIATSFVSGSKLSGAELPALVRQIHSALTSIAAGKSEPKLEHLVPPVPIKNSVKPDYIICLEDGKKFKSLKRHLKSFDLTPDQYRAKWGLSRDYPMVAPAYAAKRSELAKSMGLGSLRKKAKAAKAVVNGAPSAKRRARKK
jgi:predicted transcriptional regulator